VSYQPPLDSSIAGGQLEGATPPRKLGKVVLAYSGGLDTSCIVPWLKENYDCEVIAFAATSASRTTSPRSRTRRSPAAPASATSTTSARSS
jgi:hypothetical protein